MARLAATEYGADWVIHSDADEFWWPRGESLKDVLASIPARYGIVRALLRHFVPRPDGEARFAERMTVAHVGAGADQRPAQPLPPEPEGRPPRGPERERLDRHAAHSSIRHSCPLRGWYPIEFLHFPVRSLEQCERKYAHQQIGPGQTPSPYYDRVRTCMEEGRIAEFYESLVVDDDALERGLQDGTLVIDTRLRDALRAID